MPLKKVKDYLDNNGIKYIIISHSPAYTAMEVAESAHIPGNEIAKTVMVKIDGSMTMIVLPASYKIDFDLLKEITSARKIELAAEQEFKSIFPYCEVGAMPPFGNLYNLGVYVTESLTHGKEIAFHAGTHNELIKIDYNDFKNLVKPKILKVSVHV